MDFKHTSHGNYNKNGEINLLKKYKSLSALAIHMRYIGIIYGRRDICEKEDSYAFDGGSHAI